MNKELLQKAIDEKLVTVQKHPQAELWIYNYSQKVQFDKLWTEVTLQTRGLILDANMNYVARPFGKFFNYSEIGKEGLPNEPFEVFSKEDGSLGILYWLNDVPYIATRGSFASDQAIHATHVLHTKYAHLFDKLNKNHTYLLEIIAPFNRIVIDYGDMDDLILLAQIDTATGKDVLIEDIGFPIVKRFDGINDIEQLKGMEEENKEGFVIKFKSGYRVKLKFEEYVRLHRIITGVSNVAIWEYMAEGKPLDELLDKVPDEFYNYVKKTQSDLLAHFDSILSESKSVFKELGTRKETALYFQTQKYPSVLFSMLDGRVPDKIIWKMIRPKFCKPFKTDES